MFIVVHSPGTQAKMFFLTSAVFLVASLLFSVVLMSSVWAGPAVTSSTASSMSTTLPRVLTNSATRAGLGVALPSMQIPQTLQQSPRGSGGVLRGGRSLMQGVTKGVTKGALKRVPAGRLLLPLAVGGLLWRGWPWRTGYPGAERTLENSLSGKWSAGPTLMTTKKHTSQSARRRDPDVAANAAAARAAAASSVEELREDYELALAAYLAMTPRQWRWRMQLYIDAPLLLDKLERVPRQRLIEDIAAELDLRSRRYSTKTSILSSRKQGLYIFIVYMMSLDPPSQVEVARRLGIPLSNVQTMITAIQQIFWRRRANALASPTVDSSIASGIAPGIASKTVQPYYHSEGPLSVLIEEYESMPNQRWHNLNSSLLADDPVKLEVLSNIPRKSILEAIEQDHGGSKSGADDHAQRLKGIRAQYVYLSHLMKLGPPKEQSLSALAKMLEVSRETLRELTSSISRLLDQLSSSAHSEEVESQKFWVELEGKVAHLTDLYVDMPYNQWLERMTLVVRDSAEREALMRAPLEDHLRAIDEYSHTLPRHTGGRGDDSHYFEIRALSYQYVFLAHLMRLSLEKNRSDMHLTRYLAYTLNYHHRVKNHITVALRSLARHERGRGSEAYKNARAGISIEANRLSLVNSPEWGVVDEFILVRRYKHYTGLRRHMLKINSEELRKRLQDLLPGGKALPKSLEPRMVLNYLETQFSQGPVHLFLAYDLAIAPRSNRRIIEGYYPNVDLSEDIGVTKEIIDQLDSLAQKRRFHIEYLSVGEYSLLNKAYWAPWRTKATQRKILHGHYIDPAHAESFIEGVEQLRDRYHAEAQVLYGRQLQDPRARYKELVLVGYLYYGHGFAIEDAYTHKVPPLYTLYFQRAEVRDDFMALVEQLSIPPH